jgi:hypothetical protein
MPLLKYGEWLPDTTDYESDTVYNIQNVIPRGDGYGPFPDFSRRRPRRFLRPAVAAFYALKSDGTVQVYAGTSTGLYRLNNTDLSWIPVSRVTTCTITSASPGVITETAHGASGKRSQGVLELRRRASRRRSRRERPTTSRRS